MHGKTERVEGMLPSLMEVLKLSDDHKECALAAAPLAMADLGTSVVMEFTNLAGIMGRHYAEREGQTAEVWGGVASEDAWMDVGRDGRDGMRMLCSGLGVGFLGSRFRFWFWCWVRFRLRFWFCTGSGSG